MTSPVSPPTSEVGTSQTSTNSPADDELPEWEPLTPELVEEEAIRGDAMLRNAVAMLAVLLSWVQISDTSLLVRIRSGEATIRNGLLPLRTDPFAVTTEGREWINLGWLSDVGLSALYRAGGVLGAAFQTDGKILTLWGVLATVATFWLLSRISIKGLPTWWSSICAGLALVAAFPALTPGPVSVTLLGFAALLLQIQKAGTGPARIWPFAVLFVLWSNLDPNVWFGLAVVWSAAIGGVLTADDRQKTSSALWRIPVKLAVVCTLSAMVNPFHWHVLEAPLVLFGTELPAAPTYGTYGPYPRWMLFALNKPGFWSNADLSTACSISLAVLTLVTLILNSRAVSLAHVAVFVVTNALAANGGVLWPAASLVNAVLAGLNGQEWYSRTFRQTYSVAWSELLFSRGGRAVTVLGLFFVAYLMINGALSGASGRRLGMGFDWRIRTANASYARLAAAAGADQRGFNGRPDHGDLMIWAGLRPFCDSRLPLFARGGEDLLNLHRLTFRAMQVAQDKAPETGQPEFWKATFDRFQLKHVYARLTGDDDLAKYNLLQNLMLDPELVLQVVEAAAARLDRTDVPKKASPPPAPVIGIDFVQKVFRDDQTPITEVAGWPRELTTYERWLIQPEPAVSDAGQLAEHEAFLGSMLLRRLSPAAFPGETSHALRVAAIRNSRRSLLEDPNTPSVYVVLRDAFAGILTGEQGLAQSGMLNDLRIRQLLAANYFSLLTSEATAAQHEQLALFLASLGYRDVALEHLQRVYQKTGRWTSIDPRDGAYQQQREQNEALLKELERVVGEIQSNANRELQRGEDPLVIARGALNAGCPQFALSILTPLETQIIRDPMSAMFHAEVLMAVGRFEEAWERLEGIESLFPPDDAGVAQAAGLKSQWRLNTAIANMVRGDYERALTLWRAEASSLSRNSVRSMIESLPLTWTLPARHDLAGLSASQLGAEVLYSFPERWAGTQFLIAVAEIERGDLSNARLALSEIQGKTPQVSIRPLVDYYHQLLTGKTAPLLTAPEAGTPVQEFLEDGTIVVPAPESEKKTTANGDNQPAAETPKTPPN